jgi:hypothetical protein
MMEVALPHNNSNNLRDIYLITQIQSHVISIFRQISARSLFLTEISLESFGVTFQTSTPSTK